MVIAGIILFLAILVVAEVTSWDWTPLYKFLSPKNSAKLPTPEDASGIISIPLKREPRPPSETFKNPPKWH